MFGIGLTTQRIKLSSVKISVILMHELIKIKQEAINSRVARSTCPLWATDPRLQRRGYRKPPVSRTPCWTEMLFGSTVPY